MGERTLVCGVVGAGMMGRRYIGNIRERFPQIRVKRVCAAHLESARRLAEGTDIIPCTYDELLADDEIRLVLCLTPACTHEEIIRRALEAGKHVYTEKTMTIAPETAKALAELADERGLMLGSAPDTFLGASLQTARQAIDRGLIGEPTSFVAAANRDNNRLLSRFSFLRMPGGGICYDYGVYYLTAIVSLLGPVAETAAFVRAPWPTHINNDPKDPLFGQPMDTPNESEVSAILRLRSGLAGTFHLNADSVARDQAHFMIYGTKGILMLGDPNQFGCPVRLLRNEDGAAPEELPVRFGYGIESRGLGAADLAAAVLEGGKPRADKSIALHVEEVLSAMLESGEDHAFHEIVSTCERPEPMPELG